MKFLNKIKGKLSLKKIVVIAEKYSVAAEYATVMKCEKKDGYFEGEKYIIVWTDGHLCTLYSPEDYDSKYKKWRMEDLPIVPNGFWVKVRKSKGTKVEIIKKLIAREDVSGVCIGTDSAREGNLIAEYVLMLINNQKPVYRIMINALNAKEITLGFKEMKPADEYKTLSLAAKARDEIDWLIGVNLSRAYSVVYDKKYYVGRCKTVILSILCKRENEINKFESKIYYTISAAFQGEGYKYSGNLISDVIINKASAEKIISEISNNSGKVSKIDREIKSIEPSKLFNLNDLIIAVNRRYGYAAEEIYYIAQKLYEEYRLISYARTDSRYVKTSMLDEIKVTLNCMKFGDFNTDICDIKDISKFVNRCVDDTKVIEHSAIIPIVNNNIEEVYGKLSDVEKNVYCEIVNNFIANFKDNYEYQSISIETLVGQYSFITKTQKVINPGWKSDKSKNDNNQELIKENDEVKVFDVKYERRLTKGPERYTDCTLFELLENPGRFVCDKRLKSVIKENGIGTNATRALILKDLIENGYVIRDKKCVMPTIDGQELISVIKTEKLTEPFFTAEIEDKLQQIQEGKLNKDDVVKETIMFIEDHISELKIEYSKDDRKVNKVIGLCPFCKKGKVVKAGNKGYGCTELKNTGCRFYISNNILGTLIDQEQVYKLISSGQTDPLDFNGKKEKFTARIVLNGKSTKFKKCKSGEKL